jgi:hypothetical protein
MAAWLRQNHPDLQLQADSSTADGHYEGDI